MRDDNDNNYISVGGYMLMMLIPLIPGIGWILVLVLAFVGSNQTRKNFYRAMIAWVVLFVVGLFLLVFAFDAWPSVAQYIKDWQAKHPH